MYVPTKASGPQALSNMRVLDLTQIMAGPYCTMVLADMGADVIKVENPVSGDQTRKAWGDPSQDGDSRAFISLNRNKRSVALDLKSAKGLSEFYRLVETADVVVENFRPGVAKRLEVDYDSLKKIRPEIVCASISGFGQDGPYAQRPGYDLIAQAMSGVMSVTGEHGGRPVKAGIPIADLSAGLFAAIGILGAFNWRQQTGEGQYIETSLFESAVALSVWESVEYWESGVVPGPLGSAHRLSAPYQALAARDGHITIGANNPKLWVRLCEALEMSELVSDERFVHNAARMQNRPVLIDLLEERLATRDVSDWVAILLDAGVPCGPIRNYRDVLDHDPHVSARGLVQQVVQPERGKVSVLASPIKMESTPIAIRRHAPLLGEHTESVLSQLQERG